MSIDPNGVLYVANYSGSSVTIYPAGATSPSLTLSQGLTQPIGVVTDSVGNVYVSNRSPNQILVYPPGQTTPATTYTSSLFTALCGMFFDGAGTLYVGDNNSGVLTLAKGSGQFVSLGLQGVREVGGLTMDAKGDLFVTDIYRINQTFVYPPGQLTPSRHLQPSIDSNFLTHGSVRGRDYVFAPNWESNTVTIFRDRGDEPIGSFTTPGQKVLAAAYKPPGVP